MSPATTATKYDNDLVTYGDVDWEKIPNKYKYRPMPLTLEQMEEWQIPLERRDFCVDKYLELMKCEIRMINGVAGSCAHENHAVTKCYYREKRRQHSIRVLRESLGR
jgi:hypothetical protein